MIGPTLLATREERIIENVMRVEGLSELDALDSFFGSQLYQMLKNADSGVWTLSTDLLSDVLIDEIHSGILRFPEGV